MNMESLLETLKIIDVRPTSLSARLTSSSYRLGKLLFEIEKLAPELDFQGQPYNGLRGFIKMVNRLIPIAIERIKSAQNLEPLVDTVELYKNLAEVLVDQAAISIQDLDNCPDLQSRQVKKYGVFLENVALWWKFAKHNQKLLASYFTNFMLFYVDPELRGFMVNSNHTMAVMRSPQDAIGCAINPQSRGNILAQLLVDGSLYFPLRVWAILDNKILNSITSWRARSYNVSAETVFVPRQDRWIIPADGRPVQDQYKHDQSLAFASDQETSVRCRLIKNGDFQPNRKLIVHISGGGFVMFKPEMNEGCYLRFWSGNLEGTTILSIDYTKLVAYPTAFQEVLDAYLWLARDSDEVQLVLGFVPEEIVLVGDSAGSHLAFAVVRALNDMKSCLPPEEWIWKLPKSFVSFYSNMTIVANQCSLGFTCLESALTPSVILSLYGLIASGLVLNSDEQDKSLEQYSKPNPIRDNSRTWIYHGKNWFDCSKKVLKRRFDAIRKDTLKAYLRPMTERDVERLAYLSLYVVVGEYDFFLDGCINIARAWRGKVKLDVVENVNHGFLSQTALSKACQKGSEVGLKRIKEAVYL